jgi:hypothetical protein
MKILIKTFFLIKNLHPDTPNLELDPDPDAIDMDPQYWYGSYTSLPFMLSLKHTAQRLGVQFVLEFSSDFQMNGRDSVAPASHHLRNTPTNL